MSVRVIHDTRGSFGSYGNVIDRPCPAILVGRNSLDSVHYQVVTDDAPARRPARRPAPAKPLYSVPSMMEIQALPWNGFNVISLFSGCGGSCLGFRMAGFRVLWANEFVEAARDTYRANSETLLDARDIRTVQPEEILAATGLKPGELHVLEGSPPCASFSTAGVRERDWAKVKKYSDTVQRSDDLFHEYARILRGLMPQAFVAENVSGLVKGVAKGYFIEILTALKSCGYRVKAKVLDAQWLGVPQARQRVIFMGVREDLGREPAYPEPLPYRFSVRDALPWITDCTTRAHGFTKSTDLSPQKPAPTLTTSQGVGYGGHQVIAAEAESRKFTIDELKRICAFPDDFVLTGTYAQQWERLGRAVPPLMMRAVASALRDKVL